MPVQIKTFGEYWESLDFAGRVRFVIVTLLIVAMVSLLFSVVSLRGNVTTLKNNMAKLGTDVKINTQAINDGRADRAAEHSAMTDIVCEIAHKLQIFASDCRDDTIPDPNASTTTTTVP